MEFDKFIKYTGAGYKLPEGVNAALFPSGQVLKALQTHFNDWNAPLQQLKFAAQLTSGITTGNTGKDFVEGTKTDGVRKVLSEIRRPWNNDSSYSHTLENYSPEEVAKLMKECEDNISITTKAISALAKLVSAQNKRGKVWRDDIEIHRHFDEKASGDFYDPHERDICHQLVRRANMIVMPALKAVS